MLETEEILKSSTSELPPLFFVEAMNALRPASPVRLIRWSLVPALVAGLLTGSVSPSLATDPAELALLRPARDSRFVLDLSKLWISLVRGEQQLETWPVVIGDPKTPTQIGEFPTLNKKVNLIYVPHNSGQRRALRGSSSPIGDRYLAFHLNGRGEFWNPWNGLVAVGSDPYGRQLGLRADAQHPYPAAV